MYTHYTCSQLDLYIFTLGRYGYIQFSNFCTSFIYTQNRKLKKKNYMHDNYFNMQLDFWLLHIKSTHAATQYICLIVFLIVQIFIICKKKKPKKKTNNKQDIYKAAFHF